MTGHKGYGATSGSGRLPAPKFRIDASRPFPGSVLIHQLAADVRRAATELQMTPAEVLAGLRKDGIVDCNDTAAEQVLEMVAQRARLGLQD